MATIEDVATLAGVSIATVSRVVNNSYIVSQEKRERVMAAVKSLGYQPNRSASKKNENKIIMLAGSTFIDDTLAGMKDKAKEYGYDIIFSYFCNSISELLDMNMVKSGLVDGVILMNMIADNEEISALSAQMPVVQCGEYQNAPHTFSVSINEAKAAGEVVSHLISLGRKRVALIVPHILGKPQYFIQERELGYRLALAEHNIDYHENLKVVTNYSTEGGIEAARKILTMKPLPDAIFCANDTIAIGCISTLRDAGIKIPDQIAVAGFDNMDAAEFSSPPLTTIAQPFYEIGSESVRLLMTLMKENISVGRHVMIDHQLELRASTIGQAEYEKRTHH